MRASTKPKVFIIDSLDFEGEEEVPLHRFYAGDRIMKRLRSFGDDSLSAAQLQNVDAICQRFESAWKQGERPLLERYLPEADANERTALLFELLWLEVHYRRGEADQAEFEARFPDDTPLVRAVLAEVRDGNRTSTVEPPMGDGPASEPGPDTVTQIDDQSNIGENAAVGTPPLTVSFPNSGRGAAPVGLPAIPGYTIETELGRGGMGVVYKARHLALKRTVALKMVLAGGHAGAAELARFRAEAEAVARLQHPNIVQIHEIGEHNGLPFFSLEFCAGGTLAKKIDGTPCPAKEAAGIVQTLAGAIHAAHCQNIIHRDLKPANVLLQMESAQSTSLNLQSAIPKITDFGLAKKLDAEEGQTHTGAIMGTPSYMSPEQARGTSGEADAIGPGTDIYALGTILYELLTGRPPFKAATPLDTVMQVISEEPVAPTRLNREVPRDLETICLKCLEKDVKRRFATAAELADDLGRYLRGEPVRARPVSDLERAWKWAKRRPALACLIVVLAVAGTGLIGFTFQLAEQGEELKRAAETAKAYAKQQEDVAAREKEHAERETKHAASEKEHAEKEKELRADADAKRADADAAKARADEETKKAVEQARRLAAISWRAADNAWELGRPTEARDWLEAIPLEFRGWEWGHLRRRIDGSDMTLYGHLSRVKSVAFSPDGRRLASASDDGQVKLRDVATGEELFTLQATELTSIAFSPDGRRIAAGGFGGIKLFDATNGQELGALGRFPHRLQSLAFSPDGRHLAGSGSGSVQVNEPNAKIIKLELRSLTRIWDTVTRQVVADFDSGDHVAYSPDGARFATAGLLERFLRIWDVHSRTERARAGTSAVCISFSPDGRVLATGHTDNTIKLWDAATGRELRAFHGHRHVVDGVAFSPDGRRLASASKDFTLKIWDVATGQEQTTLRGHTSHVLCVAFSADGRRLVSGSEDRTVKIWDVVPNAELSAVRGVVACVSADGRRLVTRDGIDVRLWDAVSGQEIRSFRHGGPGVGVMGAAMSPDGQRIASTGHDRLVKVWDVETGRLLHRLDGHGNWTFGVAFSPDSRRLASSGDDQTVKVWDVTTGACLHTLRAAGNAPSRVGFRILAFSPDGRQIAAGPTTDATVRLWDAATGQELHTLRGHSVNVDWVIFSPDSRLLASAGQDHTVRLWDTSTGKPWAVLATPTACHMATFSPDGRRLVTNGALDGSLKIWDVATGLEVGGLRLAGPASQVAFAPDGRLFTSGAVVQQWQTGPIAARRSIPSPGGVLVRAAFSDDGDLLYARVPLGPTVYGWDWRTGQPVAKTMLPTPGDLAKKLRASSGVRHPTLPLLALAAPDRVELIHLSPPDAYELARRRWRARFDAGWHESQARACEQSKDLFAAVFHWSVLTRHQPASADHWTNLSRVSTSLGDWRLALSACTTLLNEDPMLAPIYFRRASVRVNIGQFHEAAVDQLMGALLTASRPPGKQ
jgi:WD40 repeat protein